MSSNAAVRVVAAMARFRTNRSLLGSISDHSRFNRSIRSLAQLDCTHSASSKSIGFPLARGHRLGTGAYCCALFLERRSSVLHGIIGGLNARWGFLDGVVGLENKRGILITEVEGASTNTLSYCT